MTERERMEAGMWYDANFDPVILEAVAECKDLCHEYNQMRPSARIERQELLRSIVGSMGERGGIKTETGCRLSSRMYPEEYTFRLLGTTGISSLSSEGETPEEESSFSASLRPRSLRIASSGVSE